MGTLKKAAGIACIIIWSATALAGATFHPGDRGDQITAIQQALIANGSDITADGDYGTGMTQAVKNFQANPNAQDTNGNTVLHMCVIHEKMVNR